MFFYAQISSTAAQAHAVFQVSSVPSGELLELHTQVKSMGIVIDLPPWQIVFYVFLQTVCHML